MTKANNSSQIIRGCWQLSVGHHQRQPDSKPILDAIESGFTTFDCGDIYVGVEEMLGKAAKAFPEKRLRFHTKFVPDLDRLATLDRTYVRNIVDRSRRRLQVDCLDLVQLHWWDFGVPHYLSAMDFLAELQAEGKIAQLGLTNVNQKYLEEFSSRFAIASLQVQASLFDRRVERGIGALCRKKNIRIFVYGSLLGGFLSEKWLGQKEPSLDQLANRSLVKYKLLLDAACEWKEFQRRLATLSDLATKYRCELAHIAIAALLQTEKADAVIVGLSPDNYAVQSRSLAQMPLLDANDLQEIGAWTCNLSGDAYDEERDPNKAHAKVMKFNLNAE